MISRAIQALTSSPGSRLAFDRFGTWIAPGGASAGKDFQTKPIPFDLTRPGGAEIMSVARCVCLSGALFATQAFALSGVRAGEQTRLPGTIVRFGTMHEAIGQQHHQGRATFAELLKQPHFFAVAALEGLRGEATVVDGQLTVTRVDAQGRLLPVTDPNGELQATLLVGGYVDSWSEHVVPQDVPADKFDDYIAEVAGQSGIDLSQPLVFTLEGTFQHLKLHVINGACPLHARLKQLDLAAEERPFEAEFGEIDGTVVGIFAKDAVGKLTHPATSTHNHLVFTDPASQSRATGHIEQAGIGKGSVLRFPKARQ